MNYKRIAAAAFLDLLWIVIIGFLLMKNSGDSKLLIRLLSPRYWWLLWMSFGFFVLFFLNKVVAIMGYCDVNIYGLSLTRGVCLLIPAILLPFSLDGSLGADILDKRVLSKTVDSGGVISDISQDSISDEVEEALLPTQKVNIEDMDMADILNHSDDLLGTSVSVIGLVGNNTDLPLGVICLFRFFSSCCAADAFPAGLLVKMPEDSVDIPDDQWLRIKGELTLIESEGEDYTGINAITLEEISEPPDPIVYLYY